MLVEPVFALEDPHVNAVLSMIGGGSPLPERTTRGGVFLIRHFSLGNLLTFPEPRFDYEYPEFQDRYHECIPADQDDVEDGQDHGYFNSYGVCDSPEQLMEFVGDLLDQDEREFVVSVTHIPKKKQPAKGGWRWHKWGPYIGTGKSQCEYLSDEPGFEDGVFVYHVYQLGGPLFTPEWKKRLQAAKKASEEDGNEEQLVT